jgi:hypothetical protein
MTDVLHPVAPEEAVLVDPERDEHEPSSWDERTDRRRAIEIAVSIVVVGGAVLFTLAQLYPSLLFSDSTPTGGDMGAHVWGPAFLRDHVLPHFRLTGWANDWYAGFPIYVFYMLPPALMVVLLDIVLPYGEALKIISALGILTLPICCWAFGKLSGMRFPIPPLLAVASVVFLFDETFQIYGGNIASTMAGEYSFSIALSLAMLFFGVFAYALRTGKHRATAAVLFALACLSHGIVIFFVVIGAGVLFLLHLLASIHGPIRSGAIVRVALTTTVVGGLLSAFWVIPFVLLHRYGTDMFYDRNNDYAGMLFPQPAAFDWLLTGVALIGLLGAVLRRSLSGLFLGIMSIGFGVWAVLMPQSLLWNNRLLPFMYLTRYMLAAVGVVEIGRAIARLINPESRWLDWNLRLATLGVAAFGVWLALGLHFRVLPFGGLVTEDGRQVYAWPADMPILKSDTGGYVKYWAKWNYEGYEAKEAYGEYHGIVNTMKQLGDSNGCGRALWENNNDQNKYGTPMALMLLPFWTDGCIGSMEGLFFEASGTTPYHFLTTSALSKNASDPVRRLRYEKGEVDKGVEYLQTLGVRYYLAYNPEVVSLADQNPDLVKVATSGPWHVYEVQGIELVSGLATQPVVVEDVDGRDSWLELGTSWFQNQDSWDALPVADGPDDWQRIEVAPVEGSTGDARFLDEVAPTTPIEVVPQPEVVVSEVETGDDSISFKVDRVGVPVLVRTSYFPNWKAEGADGPYRAAPNLMVVVPTSNEVTLHYGYTTIELGSYALTAVGLAGVIYLWRSGQVDMLKRPGRRRRGAPGTDPAVDVVVAGSAVGAGPNPFDPWGVTGNGDTPFLLDWDEVHEWSGVPDDQPAGEVVPQADPWREADPPPEAGASLEQGPPREAGGSSTGADPAGDWPAPERPGDPTDE